MKLLSLLTIVVFSLFTFAQKTQNSIFISLKLKDINSKNSKVVNSSSPFSRNLSYILQKYNAEEVRKIYKGKEQTQFLYSIGFPIGLDYKNIINELYQTNEIEFAELDSKVYPTAVQSIVPNDEFYNKQWWHKNTGSFPVGISFFGADIEMEKAWEIEQGDSNIVVAIIDSGIDFGNKEFKGRFWNNLNEIPNNGIDDDFNGYVDDTRGWDIINEDNYPADDHLYKHGTRVAGLLAANGNDSRGYAGVDWNCKLMILKILSPNEESTNSMLSEAIYYAVDNGANVINLSLGSDEPSIIIDEAISYAINKGIVVVVSMGNMGTSNYINYLALNTEVIAVGATSPDDSRDSHSSIGSHISVVAPGSQMTFVTDYSISSHGTSYAAPLVSGLASLLLAQDTSRKPIQIKSIIESTAEDLVGNWEEDSVGFDIYHGYGRINAFRALSKSLSVAPTKLKESLFSIYPNPTTGAFKLYFDEKASYVEIFNSRGQLILSREITDESSVNFELSNCGIYIVKLITQSRSLFQKVIIN